MVGRQHRLCGHEFEQTLGDGEGQASMGSQRVEHNQATEQQPRVREEPNYRYRINRYKLLYIK